MAELKRISFPVAKAIKEAGYPQDKEEMIYHTKPCCGVNPGNITSWNVMSQRDVGKNYVVAPTYLEVWLWLWREKNINIYADLYRCLYINTR